MTYMMLNVTIEGESDDVTLEVVAEARGIVRIARIGPLFNRAILIELLGREPGFWLDHRWVPLRWVERLGGVNFECGLERLARESQRRNLGP